MQSEIIITEPKIEDAKGSIEVQYKAWLDTYPNEKAGITTDDIDDRYKDAFEGLKLERRQKVFTNPESYEKAIVAKDGDTVVGYCYVTKKDGKNQLTAMYILSEYHGQGIGTKMWEYIKDFFDEDNDIYVEVADYNEKAIAFYKKLGFVDTGRRWTDERFRMKSGHAIPEMEMKISK